MSRASPGPGLPADGTLAYHCFRRAFATALMLVADHRIIGREHIPPYGPFIVVANHLSLVDPPLISHVLPMPVTFLAKEEALRSPLTGPFARAWRAIPVRRGEPDLWAIRQALAVLAAGGVLGLFPEGTRSRNHRLQVGQPGAALLAVRSGAPILPIAITGTEQIFRWPGPFRRRRPLVVTRIGRLFSIDRPAGRLDPASLTALTEQIMAAIAALLPSAYGGRAELADETPADADRAEAPSQTRQSG